MASNGEKVSIWWRHHDSHLASSLVDNNAFKIVRIAVIYCSIYYPIYARRHQFIWPITEYKTQRVPAISAKFCQQLGTTESSNTEPLHRNLTNTSWDSCDILCNQWVIDLCYDSIAGDRNRVLTWMFNDVNIYSSNDYDNVQNDGLLDICMTSLESYTAGDVCCDTHTPYHQCSTLTELYTWGTYYFGGGGY